VPSAIRRIHSKYLGEKVFQKDITEFEIREFFTLSAADMRKRSTIDLLSAGTS